MSRLLTASTLFLAAATALPATALAGDDQKPVPEFSRSIAFDQGDPQFRVSDLRGKMVIMFFFQGWSPRWLGIQLSQTAAAFGSDRAVVLIAIKSDGGEPAEAKRSLAAKTDISRWLVLTDRDGQYFQQVIGNRERCQYAVLDPRGNIADAGEAGWFYDIDGKQVYTTAMPNLKEKFGAGAKPVLPGKEYAKELAAAVAAAELRDFRLALAICARAGGSADLKKDIIATASEGLEARAKTLKTVGDPGRFEAFVALRKMAYDLNGTEPGKTAAAAVNLALNDATIAKELAAERDYNTLAEWAAVANPKQRKEQMPALLEKLAKLHEGTVFGARAAAEFGTGKGPAAPGGPKPEPPKPATPKAETPGPEPPQPGNKDPKKETPPDKPKPPSEDDF